MLIKEEYKIYKITHSNWKTPTIYEISNYGNCKKNGIEYIPNKNVVGYLSCGSFPIHRMVAETFIPNPNNYKEVDHIDGNIYNNQVTNLRWVTHKENLNNPISRKRNSDGKIQNWQNDNIRKKYVDAKKGKPSPLKGKTNIWHHSEETKHKISERTKGKNNPMYGKNIKDYMSSESYNNWLIKIQTKQPMKNETKLKIAQNSSNRKWICLGNERKFVKVDYLKDYLDKGWNLGMK